MRLLKLTAISMATMIVGGCAQMTEQSPRAVATEVPPTSTAIIGEVRAGSGVLKGYLDRNELPNSLALLPPPPVAGSPTALDDAARFKATRALVDSPRWKLAAQDANYVFPKAAEIFACSLGLNMSEAATPHLVTLMRRAMTDAGLVTYTAKDRYQRVRPFVAMKQATCDPAGEARLLKDGSYPSGHAALGWAWGLVLTEVAPDKADALLARAYAYGESREVCGVHWHSDVEAGRLMASAAVARLHANPLFKAQMALAQSEVNAMRAKGGGEDMTQACAAEAQALAPNTAQ